jgi:hypothetical protein
MIKLQVSLYSAQTTVRDLTNELSRDTMSHLELDVGLSLRGIRCGSVILGPVLGDSLATRCPGGKRIPKYRP